MSAYDVRGVPDGIAIPAGNGHLIVKNPGDQGLGAFGEQTAGAFIGIIRVGGEPKHVLFTHHLSQPAQPPINNQTQQNQQHSSSQMVYSGQFSFIYRGNVPTDLFSSGAIQTPDAQGPEFVTSADSNFVPSNATPWYRNSCVRSALKTGAINIGVDSIGFIPEAGGVARIIGHQAGYVGVVADRFGSKFVKAVGKSAGVGNSAVGLDGGNWTSWVSAGITVADFIPIVNDFTAAASVAWDTGVTAYKVYQCPK